LQNKIIIFFSIIIFFLLIPSKIFAKIEEKIIKNIINTKSLKFTFVQESFGKIENGTCYIQKPYYLKCNYNDKNQKQLIINKKILVIHHKRYNKFYYYPLSKSYFLELMSNDKFVNLISKSNLRIKNNFIEIEYFQNNKGTIVFFFDNQNFDLIGWELNDIRNNKTIFKIKNISKNIEFENNFFIIPEINSTN
tara:strand:+ start:10520 stop:11098 length:579 start_codon:yes stop_codon:yes gene_type:complete